MTLYLYLLAATFGLIIGSFLTACIFRIPLSRLHDWLEPEEIEENKEFVESNKDVTISSPARSFCPKCKKQLYWYENIPFFSWVFLRGKCSGCKAPIPIRYPLVELLSAASAVVAIYFYGPTFTAFFVYVWLATLIVISFIDYDYYIIPDLITYPGTIIGVIFSLLNSFYHFADYPFLETWQESLIGLATGGGGLFLVAWLYLVIRKKDGLGLGDVKLLAVVGAWLGLEGVFVTIFLGSLIGTIGGVVGLLIMRREFSKPIPFGPYLAIACGAYILGFAKGLYS